MSDNFKSIRTNFKGSFRTTLPTLKLYPINGHSLCVFLVTKVIKDLPLSELLTIMYAYNQMNDLYIIYKHHLKTFKYRCFLQQIYTFSQICHMNAITRGLYVLTHVWNTISLSWKINTFQYGYLGVSFSQYLNEFLVWLTNYKKTFILQILHELYYTYITSTFSTNPY